MKTSGLIVIVILAALDGVADASGEVEKWSTQAFHSQIETNFKLTEEQRADMIELKKMVVANHVDPLIGEYTVQPYALGISRYMKNKLNNELSLTKDELLKKFDCYISEPCRIMDDSWTLPREIYRMKKVNRRFVQGIKEKREYFKWFKIALVCSNILAREQEISNQTCDLLYQA